MCAISMPVSRGGVKGSARSCGWCAVQRSDLRASRYFAGARVQVAAEYRVICETVLLQEVCLFFVAGQ